MQVPKAKLVQLDLLALEASAVLLASKETGEPPASEVFLARTARMD